MSEKETLEKTIHENFLKVISEISLENRFKSISYTSTPIIKKDGVDQFICKSDFVRNYNLDSCEGIRKFLLELKKTIFIEDEFYAFVNPTNIDFYYHSINMPIYPNGVYTPQISIIRYHIHHSGDYIKTQEELFYYYPEFKNLTNEQVENYNKVNNFLKIKL